VGVAEDMVVCWVRREEEVDAEMDDVRCNEDATGRYNAK
jgi:hypothetical protein